LLQQSPQRREVFCEGLFRVLNARPHMDDQSPHSTGAHTTGRYTGRSVVLSVLLLLQTANLFGKEKHNQFHLFNPLKSKFVQIMFNN
jgi:hypothetical protein